MKTDNELPFDENVSAALVRSWLAQWGLTHATAAAMLSGTVEWDASIVWSAWEAAELLRNAGQMPVPVTTADALHEAWARGDERLLRMEAALRSSLGELADTPWTEEEPIEQLERVQRTFGYCAVGLRTSEATRDEAHAALDGLASAVAGHPEWAPAWRNFLFAWQSALANERAPGLQTALDELADLVDAARTDSPATPDSLVQRALDLVRADGEARPSWLGQLATGLVPFIRAMGAASEALWRRADAAPQLAFASDDAPTLMDDVVVWGRRNEEEISLVRWRGNEVLLGWVGDGPAPEAIVLEPIELRLERAAEGPLGAAFWRLPHADDAGLLAAADIESIRVESHRGTWRVQVGQFSATADSDV